MRCRRAKSLVLHWTDKGLMATNFIAQNSVTLTPSGFNILSKADDWITVAKLSEMLSGYECDSAIEGLKELLDSGLLVVEGDELEKLDTKYNSSWEWSVYAGLHCFTSKDVQYRTTEECIDFLIERRQESPSPELFLESNQHEFCLPEPEMDSKLLDIMYRRRSIRKWKKQSINKQQLSNILYSGFGVTAFVEHKHLGILPLTTTPSGGARNPYEAYVIANDVDGLSQGIYHYSGLYRSLQLVTKLNVLPSDMLGKQQWADDAPVIILCVATWKRTMWKYPHAGAYRVVLIEAGHIAQNILLAATDENLAGVPTCALGDKFIEDALGLDRIEQAAIHAIALGHPKEEHFPWTKIAVRST
jgi:SagB-type dehydrogenase family enzyme